LGGCRGGVEHRALAIAVRRVHTVLC
jgi:hypothetical protein